MKKLVLVVFLAIPLFGEDWFLKEGDSVVVNYGFYDVETHYQQGFVHNTDIEYLISLSNNNPLHLKIGLNTYSYIFDDLNQYYYDDREKIEHNSYTILESYLSLGISVDAWQNSSPFGKNNRQYFLLIGDLVTINVDYKVPIYRKVTSDKAKNVSNIISCKISTSWVTKKRILFGWGLILSRYLNKDKYLGDQFYPSFHLGYIF